MCTLIGLQSNHQLKNYIINYKHYSHVPELTFVKKGLEIPKKIPPLIKFNM